MAKHKGSRCNRQTQAPRLSLSNCCICGMHKVCIDGMFGVHADAYFPLLHVFLYMSSIPPIPILCTLPDAHSFHHLAQAPAITTQEPPCMRTSACVGYAG